MLVVILVADLLWRASENKKVKSYNVDCFVDQGNNPIKTSKINNFITISVSNILFHIYFFRLTGFGLALTDILVKKLPFSSNFGSAAIIIKDIMPQKLLIGCYIGMAAILVAPNFVKIPISLQMMAISIVIIVIASINAAKRERKRKLEGSEQERDVIGRDQAYRFPIVASLALFGMFLAFKYLPKEWVSFLLTLYGICFGGLAFATVIGALLTNVPSLPPVFTKEFGCKDYITITICDAIGLVIATPIAIWYYKTKAGLANNILASALALSGVDMLAISEFQTAAILLSGLFVYDIFWVFGSKSVFGSNVMVSVAKQFEGPIKLVFPQFPGASSKDMSMLGLGDIVVPGLFVALMLRFDIRNVSLTSPFPTRLPYFSAAVLSYFAGLVATYVALTVFSAAQPALLYLVPSCLLTAVGMAAMKGELSDLINYSEEDPAKDDSNEKDKAKRVIDSNGTESEVSELLDDQSDPVGSIVKESKKDQ